MPAKLKPKLGSNASVGREALLASTQEVGKRVEDVRDIPLNLIDANPNQPRKSFDDVYIGELADSIRERGLLNAIIVYKLDDGRYQIGAGECRWRVHKLLEASTIRAYVRPYVDEANVALDTLTENEVRKNLRPLEVVWRVADLIAAGYRPSQIAKETGISAASTSKYVAVAEHPDLWPRIESGQLTFRRAYKLIAGQNREEGDTRGRKVAAAVADEQLFHGETKADGNNQSAAGQLLHGEMNGDSGQNLLLPGGLPRRRVTRM